MSARTAWLNARVVDPASGYDGPGGLIAEDGVIVAAGRDVTADAVGGMPVVDCAGAVLAPGLIDCRVFVGEPGGEHRETLASAGEAAAAGGVTTFVMMPDTDPVIDDIALVDFIRRRARATASVNVEIAAALTKGQSGNEMTEIGLLSRAGAVAFTDGRRFIKSALVLRRLLTYARDFGVLVMNHVEEPTLAANGVMNEGEFAARLGLSGIPREAETIALNRDLQIAGLSGGRYHAALVSTSGSVDLMTRAKNDGLTVSCGVSVNHLTLNENDVGQYRTFCKLAPPLRDEADRAVMVEAVRTGAIDIIVSSHDPQDVEDKRHPFEEATFGAVGLETMLPALMRLVHAGDMTLIELLSALTVRPAKLLGLPQGRLAPGAPADFTVFDPDEPWVLDRNDLHSRAKNTPFDEARFQCRVHRTVVAGREVYDYRSQ
ncbi:MAG: dihydroorotase [Rhodobiaceae bacterium]|nr:dihydroorotase [Rhodobiaceae bacterium]